VTEETPELLWEADSTHPQQAKNIRQMLRQVMDPDYTLLPLWTRHARDGPRQGGRDRRGADYDRTRDGNVGTEHDGERFRS